MATSTRLDPLAEVLDTLEKHLELPYVPGDLSDWSDEAGRYFDQAARQLAITIETEHPRVYETISKNRVDLSHEVERMQAEDSRLLEQSEAVRTQLVGFLSGASEEDSAGQQVQPRRDRLVDAALQFILSVRKQRAAVSTWMSEALQRDNGVGD
jgi:hypothetical protein